MRVTRATWTAIRQGNKARKRGDWIGAASAYRGAIAREPQLRHIWIQLGHALKESGKVADAEAAYESALALAPNDPEPVIHLAFLAKREGDRTRAARNFVMALTHDPDNAGLKTELLDFLGDCRADPDTWDRALALLGVDSHLFEGVAAVPQPLSGSVVIDVTDLVSWFRGRRLPTGIQRVEIEVALALLAGETAENVMLCTYAGAARRWLALPPGHFRALCQAALSSDDVDDPAWQRDVRALFLILSVAPSIRFAERCVLVNLGTSWDDRTYFPSVCDERFRSGLAFVSFVYDLIPKLCPDWCVEALTREFTLWVDGLLDTADGYFAISEATLRDLVGEAKLTGRAIAPDRARVIRFDGDFVTKRTMTQRATRLADRGLIAGGFVLMVSTIEPRKNHVGAFAAWLRLVDMLGEDKVPELICVGGKGWLNGPVHAMLAAHPVLQRKVRLLSGVADDELTLLYETCRFTLYPSLYEGWGLPIAESLSRGRVPAISRASSMPEVGGEFAVYFDPTDPTDIARRIAPLIVDDAYCAGLEANIRAHYRARPWSVIARQIATEARAIAALGPVDHAAETALQ